MAFGSGSFELRHGSLMRNGSSLRSREGLRQGIGSSPSLGTGELRLLWIASPSALQPLQKHFRVSKLADHSKLKSIVFDFGSSCTLPLKESEYYASDS